MINTSSAEASIECPVVSGEVPNPLCVHVVVFKVCWVKLYYLLVVPGKMTTFCSLLSSSSIGFSPCFISSQKLI